MTSTDWDVLVKVDELTRLALRTYQVNPARIEEDANGERRIHQGGYGDRQIFELVQNAADELRADDFAGGRIEVVLTADYLYCANEGSPITASGVDTILRMGVSKKRSGQIGRFGVGVKSVLSVTRAPQFFSKTGAFGFDADWAAQKILRAVNEARRADGLEPLDTIGETPVLRLARHLDSDAERRLDRVLDELLSWATTVVRLPLETGAAVRLSHDLHTSRSSGTGTSREFPHLFQLFSPHVGRLSLDDRSNMPLTRRDITVDHSDTRRTIRQQRSGAHATAESFRVFTTPHQVSDDVRGRAGELHDRVVIDVSWAVPEYTRAPETGFLLVPNDRGVFWSFFPTKYSTTLSGALNSAWKTNEDRQNLLDSSDLNTELLRVAARLVVGALEELSPAPDPGAYLPLLPGRPKESPNWACRYLTEQVWRLMATNPSLPDQDGTLRLPADLRIHPEAPVTTIALEMWASYPGRPRDWVHHSVEGPNSRRGKVSHIIAESGHPGPAAPRTWVEALVEDRSVEASAAAVRLLAHLLRNEFTGPRHAEAAAELRRSRVLLTEDGRFVAPIVGTVFRRTSDDGLRDDMLYVHSDLANDQTIAVLLNELGVREADTEGRFHSVLDQGFAGYKDADWMRFWELLNNSGGAVQAREIRSRIADVPAVLHARNKEGRFVPLRGLILPGMIVPADGSRDAALTVDLDFHANDRSILRDFGVPDRPASGHNPEADGWFESYREAMYTQYCSSLPPTAHKVQSRTLQFMGGPTAGPLHLFKRLSPEGRAAFLEGVSESDIVETWTRQVGKQTNSRAQVISPIRWLLTHEGFVRTSQGLVRVRDALGPGLREYEALLPVAQISEAKARKLRMPNTVTEVPPGRWAKLLEAVRVSVDDDFVGRNYALLMRVAYDLVAEEADVRCRVAGGWDNLPDSQIAVATSRAEYRDLIEEGHPALLVDRREDAEQAESMIAVWGMRRVSDVIERRVRYAPAASPVALVDEYPLLRQRFGSRVRDMRLQRCDELEEVTRTPNGARSAPLSSAREDTTVLVPRGLDALETLIRVDAELDLGLGREGSRHLIAEHERRTADEAIRGKLHAIKQAPTVVAKLALMMTAEQLLTGLPAGLVGPGDRSDIHRLAQLALNAFDDLVLKTYAKQIAWVPGCPASFNGGERARQFVVGLGIPVDFAGSQQPRPDPREEVDGPTDFPVLHRYQEIVADRLVQMLRSETPRRGMLSLPTGTGKTRVAAEGVIRWVRESGVPRGPIIWIAQTEELCEQAVQSWQFVWKKVGPDRALVVDRFWSTNSSTPVTDRTHLVVATDAKLAANLSEDEYSWLREAALVIVDEAHGAGSPRYTDILRSLGLTHTRTGRHLLGLSATPFRNDEERTRLLAQRFGDFRLDRGVFGDRNPIEVLQRDGILAEVVHKVLDGADIELDRTELDEINRVGNFAAAGVLPKSAERKLADDAGRNDALVQAISDFPDDWSVLVFATSVDHARVLAARLQDKNIRSVSIDAMTAPADRRRRVDEFRAGHIRVITNYNVLSQGFDAPATRAVVIARPVYSANLYQQMIGRGLRGIANGGEAKCLILDVRDNITNFDAKLAFTEFEYLWEKAR